MNVRSRASGLSVLMVGMACSASCGPTQDEGPGRGPIPGDAIHEVLAPRTSSGFQSQVLVLGTLHLSGERERLEAGHLLSLLDLLERFSPTRIAVESLTADGLARADSVKDAAFGAGDLLPLYRWMNGQEYQRGDLTQWSWLFEGRHPDGLDRFRYAMWELRNIRQATQIMDVVTSGRPERVLVVVGSSHKPHLDRLLGVHLTVRTVQLADLETAGAS